MQEEDYLFSCESPPTPRDAAVALILLEDGRYLMQLRDRKPGIFFPGHWGLFGGAIEKGEAPEHGLRRELSEELDLTIASAAYFTKMTFDFAPQGHGTIERLVYELTITEEQRRMIKLSEGSEVRAFSGVELLTHERVVPYDAFAIWLHIMRQ